MINNMEKQNNNCTNPLKLRWYGEYKVNKPNITDCELVDKEVADRLLNALKHAQKRLDYLISITPTGDLRNEICDDNILAVTAIFEAEDEKIN